MIRYLRMQCPSCGHWNRVPVNKIFIEQSSPEPKVRVMIPMYEPVEVMKCKMWKGEPILIIKYYCVIEY